jgi:hypothetical protein
MFSSPSESAHEARLLLSLGSGSLGIHPITGHSAPRDPKGEAPGSEADEGDQGNHSVESSRSNSLGCKSHRSSEEESSEAASRTGADARVVSGAEIIRGPPNAGIPPKRLRAREDDSETEDESPPRKRVISPTTSDSESTPSPVQFVDPQLSVRRPQTDYSVREGRLRKVELEDSIPFESSHHYEATYRSRYYPYAHPPPLPHYHGSPYFAPASHGSAYPPHPHSVYYGMGYYHQPFSRPSPSPHFGQPSYHPQYRSSPDSPMRQPSPCHRPSAETACPSPGIAEAVPLKIGKRCGSSAAKALSLSMPRKGITIRRTPPPPRKIPLARAAGASEEARPAAASSPSEFRTSTDGAKEGRMEPSTSSSLQKSPHTTHYQFRRCAPLVPPVPAKSSAL